MAGKEDGSDAAGSQVGVESANRFQKLVAVGIEIKVNLEAQLFEGGLHQAGIVARVLEVVLSDVI